MNSPADLQHTVEKVCGARFLSEKLPLFAEAREHLAGPLYVLWLHDLFVLDSDDLVTDWLAESIAAPAVFLVKYLLFRGFYMSSTPDLREYAEAALDDLQAAVSTPLPSPLYHHVAHNGHLM
ncbi:hypothetical protein [Acidithiobacillus ferrooxidans]|uniref:Uncharacterized protein n=1 Tax=Acidithiobacillus ferrooxidans TaxID=920 RepID=A0A2W1KT52_ACIFR|nr:hypothetical protein [Acidithiobacillus ferrooxidans]MBU2817473.1 hypothetical protein [Acidithiobacillus ferrooxidans]MCR1344021.1 hypothetical protein [Acidithiobacillus ferrooxidans]PZD82397.1 hypothetical protein DN052_05110 [Acidithiobacillus ferrooxidans]QLK41329.1 hypothetical protein FE661_03455 [Acidithiobacillus ferrooxidans]QZT53271.1 hypothetical protein K7B00_03455 [Acidithiobacillus ferrooxidans]